MVEPLDTEMMLRLVTAVLCGGAIGLERDLNKLPTGFRTLSLVALGSCVAIIAVENPLDAAGVSRVAQGILTGIGFLGAGVILKGSELSKVKGLTTAAAIWVTSAIGILCGLGDFKLAILATALAVAILLLDIVHRQLTGKSRKADAQSYESRGPQPPPSDNLPS